VVSPLEVIVRFLLWVIPLSGGTGVAELHANVVTLLTMLAVCVELFLTIPK